MTLEMYLGTQWIDERSTLPCVRQYKFRKYMQGLIKELEKKHARLLLRSGEKPTYVLSGVPSCINSFIPLGHHLPSAENAGEALRSMDQMPLPAIPAMPEAVPLPMADAPEKIFQKRTA